MSLSKEDIKAVVACDWASEVVIPILGNYMGRLVVKLESLIDF